MKRLATTLAALCCALPAAAQPAPQLPSSLDALVAAARKEGSINLAWSESLLGGGDAAQRYAAAFNKYFKTDIKFSYAPAVEVARLGNQLYTELQTGQPASTDMFAGAAAQIQPLVKRDVLMPIQWASLMPDRITPDIVEANGEALRIQTAMSGITYNTDMVKAIPATLADFLKPEWKGKIASTPYAAGFDILAAKDLWGPEKTIDFITKFAPQVAGLIRCGDVERMATGEFSALVMDCSGNLTVKWHEDGAPVAYFVPNDAAQKRYYYLSVPRHARHPAAAALFALFFDTAPGQALMWDIIRIDLDSFKESHEAKLVAETKARGAQFTDVTIDWWDKHPEVDETKSRVIKILTTK